MSKGKITHVEIPADDPARAQRFYGELFGWQFRAMPGYDDYFLFSLGDGDESVSGAIGKRNVSAPDKVRNYITVDSVDDAVSRLPDLGGTLLEPKAEVPGQGWYAVCTDSEGNEFALWQTSPEAQG